MSYNEKQKKTVAELDLDAIMRTESGRRFLLSLLEKTGYFNQTFHLDQRLHIFNDGKREIGLMLITDMKEANPAMLSNIIKEHFDGHQ